MIVSISTDYATPDVLQFILAIFKGIEAADELSSDYRLVLNAKDVHKLTEEYKKLKHIEIY